MQKAAAFLILLMLGTFVARGQQTDGPMIGGFQPTSGPVGQTVTIYYTPNDASILSVTFGGNAAASGSFGYGQFKATVPAGAQTGVITVRISGGGTTTTATTSAPFTVTDPRAPVVGGTSYVTTLGEPRSYTVPATNSPTSWSATGLPRGLSIDAKTGTITGRPLELGSFSVALTATNSFGTGTNTLYAVVYPLPFFGSETNLGNGHYYLGDHDNYSFGEFVYLSDPLYIYSYGLSGYEYLIDADNFDDGIYLYDFSSSTFFYTSEFFPYPYMYDFSLQSVVYYFQGTSNPRYFYNFATKEFITK